MEVKPGYKQTEVGVIPEDWAVQALGDAVEFLDGRRRPVKDSDRAKMRGDIPYYGASGIVDYVNDFLFDEELILLGEDGENILSRNCRLAFKISGKTWVNNHAHVLRPRSGVVLDYLVEFLESRNYAQYNTGTAQPKLNKLVCSQIPVVCPPPPEQRAIAAALSDVDALLGGLDRLIAKKRDLKQAAMQQLLTGQTRLPGFSGAWETVSLTAIVTKTAGFWGLEKRDVAHQNHVGVVRAGDISPDGKLTATATRYFSDSEFAKAQCKLGDVVITGSGSVGKVWWCDGRADIAASNFVRILRPISKRVDGRYLFQLLLSEATQRLMVEHIATGVMANLGSSFFTTEWLHLPPPSEQRGIAEVLSDMDAELAALEARRDKTRDLKQAMMQELLTGKTRLVKPEAAHA